MITHFLRSPFVWKLVGRRVPVRYGSKHPLKTPISKLPKLRFYSEVKTSNEKKPQQCFNPECQKALNEQILAELNAAYAYLSISAFFGRTDVAMLGCEGFFAAMHEEEMAHARIFINYQNMRGGKVQLFPLTCCGCNEWNVKKALEVSLEMEKLVKDKLIQVHDMAAKHCDLALCDLVVADFLHDQDRSINEFGRLLARFNMMLRCDSGTAEFLFDKEIHNTFVRKAEKPPDKISVGRLYK